MLLTDHPHLFEVGGENYHTDFDAWDYERGHESDPWRTRPDPTWIGTPALPADRGFVHHALRRRRARGSATKPTSRAADDGRRPRSGSSTSAPTTTASCCSSTSSIRTSRSTRPSRGRRGTTRTWEGPRLIWPPYSTEAIAKGVLDRSEARQIRANYGSKLSMIDHWFGRILDALDDARLWDDTAVIVCTDHGHYLGEKDIFGQARRPGVRATSVTSPLLIAWPGVDAGGGRRAHDERRPVRDPRRRVRRRARAPHARPFARPADRRRDRLGARVRAARRLGP